MSRPKIHKKIKNGTRIELKEWDNVVFVYNNSTNEILGQSSFENYIKAFMVFNML